CSCRTPPQGWRSSRQGLAPTTTSYGLSMTYFRPTIGGGTDTDRTGMVGTTYCPVWCPRTPPCRSSLGGSCWVPGSPSAWSTPTPTTGLARFVSPSSALGEPVVAGSRRIHRGEVLPGG